MAITRNNSACTSSLTPSDSSNVYYEGYNNISSPAPSQTADLYGWESDLSPAPMDSEMTLTPQVARPSSPASVVEISRDELPSLATPAPTATKPRAKATKATKGKGKAKVVAATAAAPTSDADNPFLAADIAAATAAFLGLPTLLDHLTENTSSSRRPTTDPGSPSKHRRSNTASDTSPAPITTPAVASAAAPVAAPAAASAAAPVAAPAAAPIAAPVVTMPAASAMAPVATPAAAFAIAPVIAMPPVVALATAPTAAPAAAPAATHTTAPVIAAPIASYAVAPADAPIAAPATVPAATTAAAPVAAPAAGPVAAPATAPAAPAAGPVAAPVPTPALPPLWLMADGLPPRGSYTPTPAGGFPPIEVACPKFFLVVSGGNSAVMKTHGLICEAIGNYINIDPTVFTLSTPPTAENGSSPTLWLAADIAEPLVQAVVNACLLSSTGITIYTLPYNMPIVGFVGVFASFTLPNTVPGANAARDLMGTAIKANNETAQLMQTHRDAFGPQVSSGEA
ncbi:hypothetical protein B0H14DRAFT_2625318 [Mycena olivaceomarginata]|nr:hypothetical protein B0H14DRAFT_2625318 [Mycena olivaceomarginata]